MDGESSTVLERCLTLAKLLGEVAERDEPKLEVLCAAALEELRRRLRPGVTEEDCGDAFPLAGAFLALANLEEGGGVERFSAGDLTIQTGGSPAVQWRRQAKTALEPWLVDENFAFRGVRG